MRNRNMNNGLIVLAMALTLANVASASINPVTYGAKGDGIQDDTAAIQKALDQAAKEEGTVMLPSGTYLITDSLKIGKHVSLQGEGARWENTNVTIKVEKPGFPAIRLVGPVAAVDGINFNYPNNTDVVNPTAYPPAIQLESINPSVENVHFQFAWDGISTKPGGQNSGQALFRNITGFVHNCGIRLDGPLDVVHIDHAHFFVNGDNPGDTRNYYLKHRVAFEFGRVDGVFMNSCFMIYGETFIHLLPKTGADKPNHCLGFAVNNCWVEYVRKGFDIEGICGMTVSNCHILITQPDGFGFRFIMPAAFYNLALSSVQIRYAHKGSGPALIYNPSGTHPLTKLSVNGALFFTPKGSPSVVLGANARNFMFTGNYVAGDPAIQIDQGANFINITGNNISGSIIDNTSTDAVKNISGNVQVDLGKLASTL